MFVPSQNTKRSRLSEFSRSAFHVLYVFATVSPKTKTSNPRETSQGTASSTIRLADQNRFVNEHKRNARMALAIN